MFDPIAIGFGFIGFVNKRSGYINTTTVYTLITAANSAEAYKLKNALSSENIILGDYLELPAFMLNSGNMVRLPSPKSIAYASEILTLCLDKEIDKVYALREEEKMLLKEAQQLFEEYGIGIVHGQ